MDSRGHERRSHRRTADAWQLALRTSDGQTASESFDAIIVATPAYRAATLLAGVDQLLAHELAAIEYAGSAVISVVYRRANVAHPLDGFGFVVPAIEQRRILSASFSSVKFPAAAPDDRVLIGAFLSAGPARPACSIWTTPRSSGWPSRNSVR